MLRGMGKRAIDVGEQLSCRARRVRCTGEKPVCQVGWMSDALRSRVDPSLGLRQDEFRMRVPNR
jgi:hypothetical protein